MKPWHRAVLGTLAYFAIIGTLPVFLVLPVTFYFFAFFFTLAALLDAALRWLLPRRTARGGYTATVVAYEVGWSYAAAVSLSSFPSGSPLPVTYPILAALALAMAIAVRIDGAAKSRSPERLVVLATIVLFLPAILVAVVVVESIMLALEHAAWGGLALAAGVLPLALASHRARPRDLARLGTERPPSANTPTPIAGQH